MHLRIVYVCIGMYRYRYMVYVCIHISLGDVVVGLFAGGSKNKPYN